MRTTGCTLMFAAALAACLAGRGGAQVVPVCGNGLIEAPETCDDGNVLDGDGCSALCQVENLAPDCTLAAASVDALWPPNHRLVPVEVLGVTDPDGDPVVLTVSGVTQDEPVDGPGDGTSCPDAAGVGTDAAAVRAERSGPGDGRVYHVHFAAADGRGGICEGEVTVCVPHDRGRGSACVDGGPLYDSTGLPPALCEGEACGPEDCTPDPDDVAECDADTLPASVERRLARADALLTRAARGGGDARRLGRQAARQMRRAGARAARAAAQGDVSPGCAEALSERLASGGTCAMCLP